MDFAGVIRGLRMGSFWIIRGGPESNDRRPHKRQSRRHVTTEAETGVMRPQAQGRRSPQSWQRPAWGPLEGTARDLASGVAVCT